MRGVHQVSAGGVVFKKLKTSTKICLIARRSMKKLIWCLPKGHVEPDETLEETALREVREETGFLGSVCSSLGRIAYQFFDFPSKKRIFKQVHFFLIEYKSGEMADHDDEVEMVRWFSVGEALTKIKYPSESDILKKGIKKIESLNEKS